MQPLQRTAARSARRVKSYLQRQQRRFESHDSHGQSSPNAHPVNESFGRGFYISLALVPASFALYKFSRQGTDEQPYFTRVIANTYNEYKTTWARRNDVHTQMIEQAAADRLLYLHEAGAGSRRVDHRFPEILNTGSPWNVPAGHGAANIDALIAKYEKQAFEEEERKLQMLREDRVPKEQAVVRRSKKTPAALDS